MNDTPPIPPRSVDKVQHLETVLKELKGKNERLESDNMHFRAYCQQLEGQMNRMKSSMGQPPNDMDSIMPINEDPFVDIAATSLCAEIESCLEETNIKLKDENGFKPAFEFLLNKLTTVITLQYSSKDLQQVKQLKDELYGKVEAIDRRLEKSKHNEVKLVEIENAHERLNTEFDAVKTAINCKQMIDTNQVDALTSEFLKWKDDIRSINSKVQEQNTLIQKLVLKCEPYIETSSTVSHSNEVPTLIIQPIVDRPKPIQPPAIVLDDRPHLSPGASPTQGLANLVSNLLFNPKETNNFMSYDIIDNDANTMRTNNSNENANMRTLIPRTDTSYTSNHSQDGTSVQDNSNENANMGTFIPRRDTSYTSNHSQDGISVQDNENNADFYRREDNDDNSNQASLKIYECPICYTQVSKDMFSFDVFYNHVQNCDANQLTCVFCLKLFHKSKEADYLKHVQEEHE